MLNTGRYGWLSKPAFKQYQLQEFVIPDKDAPHWGWTSYNAYFHREIKPEARPIADPDDRRVIVSANDGTVYDIARGVELLDRFWAKGQPYSLLDILDGHAETDRFVGGDVFQSFLSGANYHRGHAPTEISSVTIGVKEGQRVKKGDELGYFSYGGSTLALLFQPGAVERYIPKNPHGKAGDDGPPIEVNAQIAVAH